jgi:hypothetical protein
MDLSEFLLPESPGQELGLELGPDLLVGLLAH